MTNLDSIQIEMTRITLNFRPPDECSSPVQKQTPLVPRTGKAAVTLDDIFKNANTFFEDNIFDGTIFSQ